MLSDAEQVLSKWRKSMLAFVTECLGVVPDPWQRDFFEAFNDHQRHALQASKGPGKTMVLACAIWYFLVTRPHSVIGATSITGQNLSDNLWPELSRWQKKSPLLDDQFVWTKQRVFHKKHPETWFAAAKPWSKDASEEQQGLALAGLHADNIMFALDEVGGIPDAVMATAEAALSSPLDGKLVIIGNPTHLRGPLYRAATSERHLWNRICITSDPDDPNRSPRVSKQWAREQIEKYGRESAWVQVNVFGQFPASSIDALIGVTEVEEAIRRNPEMVEDLPAYQKRLGVDVARGGLDSTVLFPRQGPVAFNPIVMSSDNRGDEVASRILLAKQRWGHELELVDDTGGFGASVCDFLAKAGSNTIPIHFGSKADDPRFYNKRAEMWFRMIEWVKRGGCLPGNCPELVDDLTSIQYTTNEKGQLRLESKDHQKERIGRSPDYGDALALTFAIAEEMSSMGSLTYANLVRKAQRANTDYDPWKDLD